MSKSTTTTTKKATYVTADAIDKAVDKMNDDQIIPMNIIEELKDKLAARKITKKQLTSPKSQWCYSKTKKISCP